MGVANFANILLTKLFNSFFFTLIILCGKNLVKAFGCSFLKSGSNVAVSIKGNLYARMPQSLLSHVRRAKKPDIAANSR